MIFPYSPDSKGYIEPMPNTTWKELERRLGAIFGVKRRPLSGGNSGEGRDDCKHPVLFLEAKHVKKSALWTLYRKTKKLAVKENRIPVLGIQETGGKGILLTLNSRDLDDFVIQYIRARTQTITDRPGRQALNRTSRALRLTTELEKIDAKRKAPKREYPKRKHPGRSFKITGTR